MKKMLSILLQCGICGISVGWLVGLSASPLLQGVITSIMTIIIGLLSIVSGLSPNDNSIDILTRMKNTNFTGLTSFTICLAIGASVGVYARSNEFLGLDPNKFASRWKSESYNEEEIKRRIFDKMYSKDSLSEQKQKELGSTLYSISASTCDELQRINKYKDLLNELRTFEKVDTRIKEFLKVTQDSTSIFALRKIICK